MNVCTQIFFLLAKIIEQKTNIDHSRGFYVSNNIFSCLGPKNSFRLNFHERLKNQLYSSFKGL